MGSLGAQKSRPLVAAAGWPSGKRHANENARSKTGVLYIADVKYSLSRAFAPDETDDGQSEPH